MKTLLATCAMGMVVLCTGGCEGGGDTLDSLHQEKINFVKDVTAGFENKNPMDKSTFDAKMKSIDERLSKVTATAEERKKAEQKYHRELSDAEFKCMDAQKAYESKRL